MFNCLKHSGYCTYSPFWYYLLSDLLKNFIFCTILEKIVIFFLPNIHYVAGLCSGQHVWEL